MFRISLSDENMYITDHTVMRGVPGTEDQEDLIVSHKSVILHMHN